MSTTRSNWGNWQQPCASYTPYHQEGLYLRLGKWRWSTPGKSVLIALRVLRSRPQSWPEKLLAEIRRPALCHNDLVHSNIIDGDPVRLIDWEYSAVGDPYFDLAIVVRHHQLKADRVEIFPRRLFRNTWERTFFQAGRFLPSL